MAIKNVTKLLQVQIFPKICFFLVDPWTSSLFNILDIFLIIEIVINWKGLSRENS